MNNSTKPPNKNLENFIRSTTTGIRFVKGKYDYVKYLVTVSHTSHATHHS